MALTRSQLLAGNQAQGVVLEGQVQGVKQGAGVKIEPDGTIKVDASTVEGIVKLNNPLAFNGYVWPATSGSFGQLLTSDGAGNLSWQNASISAAAAVSDIAPVGNVAGRLWFDTNEKILKVYENDGGSARWTPTNRGLDAVPANASATPAFSEGDGSENSPFSLEGVSTLGGSFVRFAETITISGFAPYQYVPVVDLNALANGNRFSSSSYFTDGNGVLTFRVLFTDYPVSTGGIAYTANLEVGFGSVFINASVTITNPLALDTVGTITGSPTVGGELTYLVGQASGGLPPYLYEWEWRKSSDGGLLQSNGNALEIPQGVDGDRVYVVLTAIDSNNTRVSGSTGAYPTSPSVISKGEFPETDILFPTTLKDSQGLPREVSTLWLDTSTVVSSDGCVEISVNGGSWGQGPYSISNGGTLRTRWIQNGTGGTCGESPNNTTITGCVFSPLYKQCASLTLDRIPSPFTFLPASDVQLSATVASDPVTPTGYNSTAFITYNGISTLSGIQASLDNGASWVSVPSIGNDTLAINPGQSFIIRGNTGSVKNTAYNAIINIGQGQSVQTATFTATTTNQTAFETQITLPSNASQGYDITQVGGSVISVPAPVSVWSSLDGSTNLTTTGCLELKITTSSDVLKYDWGNGGLGTPIATGDKLYLRWAKDSTPPFDTCGDSPHGTLITGAVTDGVKSTQGSLLVDRVVGFFDFFDVTGQAVSTQVLSNVVTISGNNSTVYLTASGSLTGLEASVNGGSWGSIPSSGTSFPIYPQAPGTNPPSLQLRGTTGGSVATAYSANLVIGDGASAVITDTWSVTTSSAVKTVITPAITSPVNGTVGVNPTTLNPAGVSVSSSVYQAINGASSVQLNSEWEVRVGSTSGTIVYSQTKTADLLSWFIPLTDGSNTVLQPNTDYFVRVRYESQDNVKSQWSPFSQFKTATVFSQTWLLRTTLGDFSAEEDRPRNVIANNGSLWMVSDKDGRVATSSDGIVWTRKTTSNQDDIWGLAGGNGLWMLMGNSGGKIKVSSNNGDSWYSPANTGLTGNTLVSIAFGGGTFVVIGKSIIQTSVDGGAWQTRPLPSNVSDLSNVIWDGSNFVAVGKNCIIYSPTGSSWTRVSTPANGETLQISHLPGNPGRYLIVDPYRKPTGGDSSTTTSYISTDLTSWSAQTLPANDIQYGAGGNGVFVVSDWDENKRGLFAWASPSGLTGTWVNQNLPTSLVNYRTVALNFGRTSSGIGRFVLIDKDFNIYSTV